MNTLVFVALAVSVCALGVQAVPPEVRAFEADTVLESSIMPMPMKSHCYYDLDEQKLRVDTDMFGALNIDISDFNASLRYIIDSGWGQASCRTCYLDEDMNPMAIPPLAYPDGTGVVNGETCDKWRFKMPMTDMLFCVQQHEPYAILQGTMTLSSAGMTVKNTITYSNVKVYKPPKAVFNTNTTECDPPTCKVPVDIAFLIDGSGSISSSDFSLMKQFARELATNFTISSEDANFAVIQFSDRSQNLFGLSSDKETIVRGIASMNQMKSSTNMDDGLETTLKVLQGSKRTVTQVVIMFTDGEPDRGNNPVAVAEKLKNADIEIYTVGVGSGVNPELLKKIATEDKNKLQPHYFQAKSFSQLIDFMNNLISAGCKGDVCHESQ